MPKPATREESGNKPEPKEEKVVAEMSKPGQPEGKGDTKTSTGETKECGSNAPSGDTKETIAISYPAKQGRKRFSRKKTARLAVNPRVERHQGEVSNKP